MLAINQTRKNINALWNTTFSYNNELKDYMKVEGAVSEDIFNYLFDVRVEKFLLEKGKKYFLKLFEE